MSCHLSAATETSTIVMAAGGAAVVTLGDRPRDGNTATQCADIWTEMVPSDAQHLALLRCMENVR